MQKLSSIAFTLLLAAFFASCDKVDDPFVNDGGNGGSNASPDAQKILLEDLTGFRCTNCPQAHDIADQLSELYGDQLIVVGIHCSFQFAFPTGATPDDPYHTDFRTPAGDEYYEFFGNPGLPTGSINRLIIDNSRLVPYSAWAETIDPMIGNTAPANVDVSINSYNSDSRTVDFEVNMSITETLEPGQYFMTAYLVEDSIFDWQLNAGVNVENYLHRHVLRDNVNGTWGSLAFDNGNAGQENSLSFQYTLDEAWKSEHCEIVAYLYHGETREIVQVDKAFIE
jgi:hypothetical protein